jgi:hypothetical protein
MMRVVPEALKLNIELNDAEKYELQRQKTLVKICNTCRQWR